MTDGKYTQLAKLGEGSYGTVYIVADSKGQKWAKKVNSTQGPHLWEIFANELNIMLSIRHPNIVSCVGTTSCIGNPYGEFGIIMPLADTTLEKLAVQYKQNYLGQSDVKDQKSANTTPTSLLWVSPLSTNSAASQNSPSSKATVATYEELLFYLYQVAIGLSVIHNSSFLHLDIKTENVLIFGNNAKLCDFSLAAGTSGKKDVHLGTEKFCDLARPPENRHKNSITPYLFSEASDVWAFGVMIASTFCGGIYEVSQSQSTVQQMLNGLLLPVGIKSRVVALLNKIFVDKKKRITLKEVIDELASMIPSSYTELYKTVIPSTPYQFVHQYEVIRDDTQFSLAKIRPFYPVVVKTINEILNDAKARNINIHTWVLCVELILQSAFNFFVTRKGVGSFKTRAMACMYLALRHSNEMYYACNKKHLIDLPINEEENRLMKLFSACICRRTILEGHQNRKLFLMTYHQMMNNLDLYYTRNQTVQSKVLGFENDIGGLSLHDFTH